MNKTIKISVLTVVIILALVFISKLLFIRVINYEIAGISIPSRYNIITGKVTPLVNYKGRAIKATIQARQANKLGLTDEQVALAQLKWALFEQWANARSEYKGWDKNPDIFKKANDEFKKLVRSSGGIATTR